MLGFLTRMAIPDYNFIPVLNLRLGMDLLCCLDPLIVVFQIIRLDPCDTNISSL